MFFAQAANELDLDGSEKTDQKSKLELDSTVDSRTKSTSPAPPKMNRKKGKSLPIRGRRIKTIGSKRGFSVDVKGSSKSSSAFHIEQNDIRKLDALMKSLSENRQS